MVWGGGGGGWGGVCVFFFFKQKTAYEMCGRDWSSDVCSSDLQEGVLVIPLSHLYIFSRCAKGKGYRCPPHALINISHGQRLSSARGMNAAGRLLKSANRTGESPSPNRDIASPMRDSYQAKLTANVL